MPVSTTTSSLTSQATSVAKVKYFPIEIYCANLLPNTTYDAYANNQLINSFCKPWGGKLGSPLTANSSGKLLFQYMTSVQYEQTYLVNPSVANNNLINTAITFSLVDPFNRASTISIPFILKSGSST